MQTKTDWNVVDTTLFKDRRIVTSIKAYRHGLSEEAITRFPDYYLFRIITKKSCKNYGQYFE